MYDPTDLRQPDDFVRMLEAARSGDRIATEALLAQVLAHSAALTTILASTTHENPRETRRFS